MRDSTYPWLILAQIDSSSDSGWVGCQCVGQSLLLLLRESIRGGGVRFVGVMKYLARNKEGPLSPPVYQCCDHPRRPLLHGSIVRV